MSENVYDNPICPDLAMEEMGEREERIVDIYISADGPDTGPHAIQRNTAQEQHADSDETKKKHRLFLVLLCVLLFSLAVIIGVVIYHSELIKEKNNNLVKERDKIQSSFDELDSRLNNLTEKIEQSGFDKLYSRLNNLTEKIEQSGFGHNNNLVEKLNSNFDKFESLETRYNNRIICELSGWKTFGDGCYYVSRTTERKNWTESRQYCEDRKSDLVVINSREEQDFVLKISLKRGWVWLGLTDEKEGTFRWVDGTPLNESQYPVPDPSNNKGVRYCVSLFFSQSSRQWYISYTCNINIWWICERVII